MEHGRGTCMCHSHSDLQRLKLIPENLSYGSLSKTPKHRFPVIQCLQDDEFILEEYILQTSFTERRLTSWCHVRCFGAHLSFFWTTQNQIGFLKVPKNSPGFVPPQISGQFHFPYPSKLTMMQTCHILVPNVAVFQCSVVATVIIIAQHVFKSC